MMRKTLFLGLFVALAACPPHEDVTPQIPIQPNVAGRMGLLPGRRAREGRGAGATARVHPMKKGEELGGSNAMGRPGDVVLENDEVVFVIDQLGSSSGFAQSGGNLVDAADARARKDELGMMFTYFGAFPRQGVYTRMTSGTSPDGAAWVEAEGRELYEPDLAVTTRYTLRPGDRAVMIETTLANHGSHAVEKLALGDVIQWGFAEKTAPGKPLGFHGKSSGPYIGGVGRRVSYAITSTEGEMAAVSGGSWTDTEQKKDVTIRPGESASYARVLVVGERPDTASIVSELILAAPDPALGRLEIALSEAGKGVVPAPAGARVSLFAAGSAGGEVLTLGTGEDAPILAGDVPPGKYELSYASGGGRAAAGAKVAVEVAADKTARATVPVTSSGRLALRVASPCKATVEGTGGTPTPDFGPAHAAGPAKNQVTSSDGVVDVPLAVGRYAVTLSRGPEYDVRTLSVDVRSGETWSPPSAEPIVLPRVVDTAGYVGADFHQHTMLGADSPVALRDRVIANAAEGVEVAVASEHNVVADLEAVARELGLASEVVEISGDEVTTDASKRPWGHANVFPLPYEPDKPRGGAPETRDRSAREIFAEIRARKLTPAPLFQVNHPRTKLTGYFDQLGFDPATGAGTDPGYDPDFDAVEVWSGRNVDGRDRVVADWFALLRTKHAVTPTANTDTHGVVGQEAGYPRTFVRVSDDAHLGAWDASRSADLARGVRDRRDVVLSNGPFLRVSANGAPIGGVATARAGKSGREVTLRIHVEHAPWLGVDRVRVLSARTGGELASAPLATKRVASGAMAADVTRTLAFTADDAIVVVVQGDTPMTPVLGGDPKEITPYAMTGAIWIDADADGESLGQKKEKATPPQPGSRRPVDP